MKKLELKPVEHNVKVGDTCGHFTPNITEDTLFIVEGKPVGFFIKELKGKIKQLVEIANTELRSKRVPKSVMGRSSGLRGDTSKAVDQYSTIIGSVPPRPHCSRPYPSISSVHSKESAQPFIKAMLLTCLESEKMIKDIIPEQYKFQKKCIDENVPDKFKFGNLFTSSISNYNIPADFHIDRANLKGCVNVIITKKHKATGGNLRVPDYDATMDSADNSLLVYPAWRNIHGVTPIMTRDNEGYRNSLVFYPLKSFSKFV